VAGAAGLYRKVMPTGQAAFHVIVAVKAAFPGPTPRTGGKEDHACHNEEETSKKH